MNTKRVFDGDPYQTSFTATLVHQEKVDQGQWKVLLDRTAFYPEAGGQPYDRGYLDQIPVDKVFEENGKIYHYVKEPLESNHVEGRIEFSRRFDHMQQHCGQHILSAAFIQVAELQTASFHLGKEIATIDIISSHLESSLIDEVENLANQVVLENRRIESRFFTREEVQIHFLKKVPSDQELIRMVHITDFDLSACCGTHPYRTGEVGMIKVIDTEKYKGMTRVTFVCGYRALDLLKKEHYILQDVAKKLKTNRESVNKKVSALLDELEETKKNNRKYYQSMLRYEAEGMVPTFVLPYKEEEWTVYYLRSTARHNQELKDLAKSIIEKPHRMVVFIHEELKSKQEQWTVALSDTTLFSVRDFIAQLIETYGGKGGGSQVFGQWTGEVPESEDRTFLTSFIKQQTQQ
ncbi:alanyl-tRNA editing protein [Caldalkalibacillus mannanilyticus]|uniref:alanyl-tRNA editing protein n=1 Tax=Caldalkalibacillus mannanilyticus TaxID=1418 RepID=UPI000469FA9D|nr:alanyl-tRNA editing protein [Caldalkalibacillus mannanilyticus]